jgi:hypothetical protein
MTSTKFTQDGVRYNVSIVGQSLRGPYWMLSEKETKMRKSGFLITGLLLGALTGCNWTGRAVQLVSDQVDPYELHHAKRSAHTSQEHHDQSGTAAQLV